MIPAQHRDAPTPTRDDELNVLLTRLPDPAGIPLPTEEEIDAIEWIDPVLDAAIRGHIAPRLGICGTTLRDTTGPLAVDVGLSEPDDKRPWGACFTIGASARPMPTTDADPRGATPCVELFLRLPPAAFRYWDRVVLEPFEDPFDAVSAALGDLGKLPHVQGACYRVPHIVATPDFSPLVDGLPFTGALLRDAADDGAAVRVPRLVRPDGGVVAFLSVTFLHASEVRALVGADRANVVARLAAAGVDELFVAERAPVA